MFSFIRVPKFFFNGQSIYMNSEIAELVKALNQHGVIFQDEPGNTYKLVYNAKVKTICDEKVIVLEGFRH